MKKLTFLAASTLIVTTIACQKKVELKTDEQKGGYAIGQRIGGDFKSKGINIDADALAAGITDAMKGAESKMKPEEMQNVLQNLQKLAMEKMRKDMEEEQKKMAVVGEENKTKGAAYLEENKKKSGVKVTSSGLQYFVEKEGTGKKPKKTDKVEVHYTGTFIDGKKFDSSYDTGKPAEFEVGQVIPGWTEALTLMKEGSKYKLTIPSDLAYGPQGRPGIPPNSVLLFDVELIKVK